MKKLGFFAYPDGNPLVDAAVTRAAELAEKKDLKLKPWKKMKIVGFKVDDLIRDELGRADVLVADISQANTNVAYEIGFAIGIGKPVIPTVNLAISNVADRIHELGLFDTMGWATYSNGDQLSDKLSEWQGLAWTSKYVRSRNHTSPLFVLDTLIKTDFRNQIFHAIDNSHVQKRVYDPTEVPRLTTAKAINEISASAGVVLPILTEDIVDATNHNLRASFLLGLSHGFGIEAMAIQYGNGPAPLDYRDFITNSTFRKETENHVTDYCEKTLVWNQKSAPTTPSFKRSLLHRINLGSSQAENEDNQLREYFIQTAEYSRALRADGAIISGRKGSGKSAVFLQVAEEIGRDRDICIVDLRPASHNLSDLRERILKVTTAGVFEHTVAAFWQYMMCVETLLKIREKALKKARNDFALQDRIRDIEIKFSLDESIVSGDFTSRLALAAQTLIDSAKNGASLSELTNVMFQKPLAELRRAIIDFRDQYSSILLLIDDLDKGWPPRRVERHDVMTIRHLIEVLQNIRRDLRRRDVEFRHLVFLRSDVYERLVEETSDRGKYNVIKVDWSDPLQLRRLLQERALSGIEQEQRNATWLALNPPFADGDAVDKMIEGSLRRPRFLIDLCEKVLSFAVNRGHETVSESDIEDGLKQMSLDLVTDFGYELRDTAGTPEDIFYLFIGVGELLTVEELKSILEQDGLGLGVDETVNLLLWYGFLGLVSETNVPEFIYDFGYDFRRLEAERRRRGTEPLFAVNKAFLAGLQR